MKNEFLKKMSKLTQLEHKFIVDWINKYGHNPVLRKFMSSSELKTVNNLVKIGIIEKGLTCDKKKSVIFYIDSFFCSIV